MKEVSNIEEEPLPPLSLHSHQDVSARDGSQDLFKMIPVLCLGWLTSVAGIHISPSGPTAAASSLGVT